EDGIRDRNVTGVQTCALPILHADNCREAARKGFATATDLADYLVRKGVPFRDAHAIVGRSVQHAIAHGCDLAELPLADLRSFSEIGRASCRARGARCVHDT